MDAHETIPINTPKQNQLPRTRLNIEDTLAHSPYLLILLPGRRERQSSR